jgi:hypothetical protein
MATAADVTNLTAVREIYGLLDELGGYIATGGNADSLRVLYQAKERVRLLIIDIDRLTAK